MNCVTYNVQLRPWQRKCYQSFNKFVEKYDIIFTQEAFYSFYFHLHGKIKLLNIFNRIFNKTNVTYSPFPMYSMDGGLITASKFPIIKQLFIPFEDSSSVDYLAQKGILYCIIQRPDGILHCINTHMQSSYSDDEWPYTGDHIDTRKKQFSQLIDFIRTLDFTEHIIIGGDFNLTNDEKNECINQFREIGILYNIHNTVDCVYSNKFIQPLQNECMKEWSDHEPLCFRIGTVENC